MSTAEDNKGVSNDRVGIWEVPMNAGLFCIEFEHGTTTGKRVIRVNGNV
jgi:hypothetical protein